MTIKYSDITKIILIKDNKSNVLTWLDHRNYLSSVRLQLNEHYSSLYYGEINLLIVVFG